jgi:NAD+ kinase
MQPAFRRVALVGKRTSEIASSLKALREFLQDRGCEVILERETAQSVGEAGASAEFAEIGRSADLAIVIGGDGTMLAAARNLARHRTPLAGINQGRLGFMTDIALADMRESVGAILDGRYSIEERSLMDAEILRRNPATGKEALVLHTLSLNEAGGRQGLAGPPDRIRGAGRRRLCLPAARRRDHRRDADRLDRVRAVGAGTDPAPGGGGVRARCR